MNRWRTAATQVLISLGILAALFPVMEVWVFVVFALSGLNPTIFFNPNGGIPPFGSPIWVAWSENIDATASILNFAHWSFIALELMFLTFVNANLLRKFNP